MSRLCEPSSELHIAEDFYRTTALDDMLELPSEQVNDDRLYRALDRLLPHKRAIEQHLRKRLGELFDLEYDLLLYDVTSTFFEGLAEGNPLAKRGHSRDHRPDCKQVCIALVVTRDGMPLSYEVFDGNRVDVTTVEEIVGVMEARFGLAHRIWVMDRGMMSRKNIDWLQKTGRKYVLGLPAKRSSAGVSRSWTKATGRRCVKASRRSSPMTAPKPSSCAAPRSGVRRRRRCTSASRCASRKALAVSLGESRKPEESSTAVTWNGRSADSSSATPVLLAVTSLLSSRTRTGPQDYAWTGPSAPSGRTSPDSARLLRAPQVTPGAVAGNEAPRASPGAPGGPLRPSAVRAAASRRSGVRGLGHERAGRERPSRPSTR